MKSTVRNCVKLLKINRACLFLSIWHQVTIAVLEITSSLVDITVENDDARDEDESPGETNAVHYITILEAIEEQVKRSTGNKQEFNTTTPNIAIVTTNVEPSQNGITLVVFNNGDDNNEFRDKDIQTVQNKEEVPSATARTTISLPSVLFDTTENGIYYCTSLFVTSYKIKCLVFESITSS